MASFIGFKLGKREREPISKESLNYGVSAKRRHATVPVVTYYANPEIFSSRVRSDDSQSVGVLFVACDD